MAISTKNDASQERAIVKRFIGVGAVNIIAVNPTKKELEAIYETELTSDPIYIGEGDVKGEKVTQARLDFIVKNEDTGMLTKIAFFLKDAVMYNKNKDKVNMINKYGETTWLSFEDAKAKITPAFISPDGLRPAKYGEQELMDFIKAWANIPNRVDFKTKLPIDDLASAECMLDKLDNMFKGDFKEIQHYAKQLADKKVKCLFGVKITDEGKMYQDAFTGKFARNGAKVYTNVEKALVEAKERGSYSKTIFEFGPLRTFELDVQETKFEQKTEDVFGGSPVQEQVVNSSSVAESDLPF